jgi:hypothetical protein
MAMTGELHDTIVRLLALRNETVETLSRMQYRGNNRLYLLKTSSHCYIVKHYYSNPEDKRDRLRTEWLFSDYLRRHEIYGAPRPISYDSQAQIALFEFIDGQAVTPESLTSRDVEQAQTFLTAINKFRSTPEAKSLPLASESCFSIDEHIAIVDKRINRLTALRPVDAADCEAQKFIAEELVARWDAIRLCVMTSSSGGLKRKQGNEERILSPSDFGFHNAIRMADGNLRFIDFEYAGWDDPAKTLGDFFSQVAVPVPLKHYSSFIEAVGQCTGNAVALRQRARLLLPVYRIKWCCIVLNHFLPQEMNRKRFSAGDAEERKKEQLIKAQSILQSLSEIDTMEAI